MAVENGPFEYIMGSFQLAMFVYWSVIIETNIYLMLIKDTNSRSSNLISFRSYCMKLGNPFYRPFGGFNSLSFTGYFYNASVVQKITRSSPIFTAFLCCSPSNCNTISGAFKVHTWGCACQHHTLT